MNARRSLAILLAAAASLLVASPTAMAKDTTTTTTAPAAGNGAADGAQDVVTGDPGEKIDSFALTPAGANNEPGKIARPDLTYAADPGSTIEDAVTVFNLGTDALTFRLYATDARNAPDGTFSLLGGETKPTDVGSWVTLAQELVTVGPGMALTVPITIKVPNDASPGDHVGGVLVSSKALSTDGGGGSVVLDRRTGARVYLRVNGEITPKLAVEKLKLDYSSSANPLGGKAKVTYRIQNRGNVRLSGKAFTSVAGPLGLGKKSSPALSFPELLPGEGMDVAVDVDSVPALVMASAKVKIEPAGAEASNAPKANGSSTSFAPPYTLLLIAALLFFGLLGRRALRRHEAADLAPKFS